ncbi:MAG: hypothetical protein QXP53_01505 [Candidatus Pacearchaeota archaeon]
MRKNKKNKRGVTIQSTIIVLIILIIGAAVLFFILKIIPYKSTAEKEACHQSVLLRGKSIMGLEPGQALVPLNCKTQHIEISSMNEETIKREIANAMYDCWWMLGEGKLQFWTENAWKEMGLGKVRSSCVICSTIKFDESVKRKALQLDMASYLEKTKITDSNITYLEYFTEEKGVTLPTDVEAPPITTDKDYIVVFSAIEGDEWWEPLLRDLEIAGGLLGFSSLTIGPKATFGAVKGVGSALLKPTVSIPVGTRAGMGFNAVTTVFAKVPYVAVGLAIVASAVLTTQVATTLNNQNIVASHCDGERKGCMQVMLIPFNAANIAGVCNDIKSIP